MGNFFPNFEFHVRYLKTSSTNYSELFSSSFSDIFAEKYSSNVGVGIYEVFLELFVGRGTVVKYVREFFRIHGQVFSYNAESTSGV